MKTTLAVIFGLVVAFLMLGAVSRASDPLTEEKDGARRGIAVCDAGVNDELQARQTRLFQRGVCDLMRKNYKEKYGSAP